MVRPELMKSGIIFFLTALRLLVIVLGNYEIQFPSLLDCGSRGMPFYKVLISFLYNSYPFQL